MTIQFGSHPPLMLKRLDGNDMAGEAESVKPPRSDGAITYHVTNSQRTANLIGSATASGSSEKPIKIAMDELKQNLCAAFNPKYFGRLIYNTAAGARELRCRPIALPVFASENMPEGTCDIDIEFISDESYWKSTDEYITEIGKISKLWRFPWVIKPTVFGSYSLVGEAYNPTTEDIYPTIEVTSTSQLVTITNDSTGEFVSINRPIAENQKMVINCEDARAEIWALQDGEYVFVEDVSYWLTASSTYWALKPGTNTVSVFNEIPSQTPLTFIKYKIPFVGVG